MYWVHYYDDRFVVPVADPDAMPATTVLVLAASILPAPASYVFGRLLAMNSCVIR